MKNCQIKESADKLVKRLLSELARGPVNRGGRKPRPGGSAAKHLSADEVKQVLLAHVGEIVSRANDRGSNVGEQEVISAIEDGDTVEMIDPEVAWDMEQDGEKVPFKGVIDYSIYIGHDLINACVVTPQESKDFEEMLYNDGNKPTNIPVENGMVLMLY